MIQPLLCDKLTAAQKTKLGTSVCVQNILKLTEENAKKKTALATLVNKRREKLRIIVANKLRLVNVKIDSLDSVLMSKDGLVEGKGAQKCLTERKRCCGAFKGTFSA